VNEDYKEKKISLREERVWEIIRNIKDEECYILGMDDKLERKDWMIVKVMNVKKL
jgi:DNA-directed RNA polymerase beta' subunit